MTYLQQTLMMCLFINIDDFVCLCPQNYPSRAMPANSPNTTSPQSSNQSQSGNEPLSRTNLYIRGLNPNTTDKDLVNLCNSWVHFLQVSCFTLVKVESFPLLKNVFHSFLFFGVIGYWLYSEKCWMLSFY